MKNKTKSESERYLHLLRLSPASYSSSSSLTCWIFFILSSLLCMCGGRRASVVTATSLWWWRWQTSYGDELWWRTSFGEQARASSMVKERVMRERRSGATWLRIWDSGMKERWDLCEEKREWETRGRNTKWSWPLDQI